MKYFVMGVRHGGDFPAFKQQIGINAVELKPIMGWVDDEDALHDYKLTGQQISDIETACSLKLPKALDLFLTSYE